MNPYFHIVIYQRLMDFVPSRNFNIKSYNCNTNIFWNGILYSGFCIVNFRLTEYSILAKKIWFDQLEFFFFQLNRHFKFMRGFNFKLCIFSLVKKISTQFKLWYEKLFHIVFFYEVKVNLREIFKLRIHRQKKFNFKKETILNQ